MPHLLSDVLLPAEHESEQITEELSKVSILVLISQATNKRRGKLYCKNTLVCKTSNKNLLLPELSTLPAVLSLGYKVN